MAEAIVEVDSSTMEFVSLLKSVGKLYRYVSLQKEHLVFSGIGSGMSYITSELWKGFDRSADGWVDIRHVINVVMTNGVNWKNPEELLKVFGEEPIKKGGYEYKSHVADIKMDAMTLKDGQEVFSMRPLGAYHYSLHLKEYMGTPPSILLYQKNEGDESYNVGTVSLYERMLLSYNKQFFDEKKTLYQVPMYKDIVSFIRQFAVDDLSMCIGAGEDCIIYIIKLKSENFSGEFYYEVLGVDLREAEVYKCPSEFISVLMTRVSRQDIKEDVYEVLPTGALDLIKKVNLEDVYIMSKDDSIVFATNVSDNSVKHPHINKISEGKNSKSFQFSERGKKIVDCLLSVMQGGSLRVFNFPHPHTEEQELVCFRSADDTDMLAGQMENVLVFV